MIVQPPSDLKSNRAVVVLFRNKLDGEENKYRTEIKQMAGVVQQDSYVRWLLSYLPGQRNRTKSISFLVTSSM